MCKFNCHIHADPLNVVDFRIIVLDFILLIPRNEILAMFRNKTISFH